MKNPQLQQLLALIDSSPNISNTTNIITPQNLYHPPAKLYFTIKTLYNSYKKLNQITLLQNKIHHIQFHFQQHSNLTNYSFQPLTSQTLCSTHNFTGENLLNLIHIRSYLRQQNKKTLFSQVILQIQKLTSLQQVIVSSRKLIKLPQYSLQTQAIILQKILQFQIEEYHFSKIANFIISLPILDNKVYQFIGQIYKRTNNIKAFSKIYYVFYRNFKQFHQNSELMIKLFIKMIVKYQTINQINQLISKNSQILGLAQEEAKNKLNQIDYILTEITKLKIEFIILMVTYGSSIWQNIIDWEKKSSEQCQKYLRNKIQTILVQKMNNQNQFSTILNIASKMTEIQQNSQIGAIFLREFLRIKDKKYLSNLVIRRFIASKILNQFVNTNNNFEKILFDSSLFYTDILLQIFTYEKQAVKYYKLMLEDDQKYVFFFGYLRQLSEKRPSKFKQFFEKIYKAQKGILFETKNYILIQNLEQMMSVGVLYNFLKDIATLPIIRLTTYILARLLGNTKYHSDSEWKIRQQIIKTINTILVHRNPSQFAEAQQFKSYFCSIWQILSNGQKEICFKDISPQMTEQIKKWFMPKR